MMTKEEIRRIVRDEREKMSKEWVKANSRRAQEMLVALPDFGNAEHVCCYIALTGEVETGFVIEQCRADGKKVYLPAFRRDANKYGLAVLGKDMKMVTGRFGVMEPENAEWVDMECMDFFVVPGVGFDSAGGRVGHGRGYYDRILEGTGKDVFKAGLAFDLQIFEHVPMSTGDVGMDAVITEKRVFKSAGGAI